MSKQPRLAMFKTAPHPCGYLSDKEATMLFTALEDQLDQPAYEMLTKLGFRRSGNHVYLPYCQNCQACSPIRIKVADFKFRRRHRRTLKRNHSVIVQQKPAQLTTTILQLYKNYIASRHQNGGMYPGTADQFNSFLISSWGKTSFLEFWLPQATLEDDDTLLAVAVTDQIDDALLAIYTFFDPEQSWRNLGTFSILQQIIRAKALGLDYVYLGYWIDQCDKMRYKADYRPHQLLTNNIWVDVP